MNNQQLFIKKEITTQTVGAKYIHSKVWRHPQVISFHNDAGELVNTCLGCNKTCEPLVEQNGECICKCDWEPKEEDL